jgi:DNA-binding transcriptional LysR family regulator
MELRHLRYFVAVAEALSFRKAAGRLSVSEPAVSQQVADLEGELGLKLFNRDSRRVELTEVGRVFLRGARRTLASAKEAVAQAEEAAAGERGRLSIGSIGPLVHAFLPDALARFREQLGKFAEHGGSRARRVASSGPRCWPVKISIRVIAYKHI